MSFFEEVHTAADFIRERTDLRPELAIILGSGLGELAEHIQMRRSSPIGRSRAFPPPLWRAMPPGWSLAASGKTKSWPCRGASTITRAFP